MPSKCEQSSLVIPNDAGYAPLVGRFAGDIAGRYGFSKPDAVTVATAVETAVKSLLTYSFEPAENAQVQIEFERIAEGLQIRLRDKGLPFEMDDPANQSGFTAAGYPLELLQEHLDEVYLNNRGREGKEVILIKHLESKMVQDYFDACLLEPFEPLPAMDEHPSVERFCRVRQLQPEDASEVSKIIYKTYGYNYPTDYVYYPQKIAAMNTSGRIHSAVAVSADDRLVGHCALQFPPASPQLAELSQGAVVPGYRGEGCFTKLTEYLVVIARKRQVTGIYSQAVTNHTHSQRTGLQFGFKDCGVLLGLIPAGTIFRGFRKSSGERGAMMLQYLDLAMPQSEQIYLPDYHHQIADRIYAAFGKQPEIVDGPASADRNTGGRSLFDVEFHPGLNFASIKLRHYGNGTVEDLGAELKKLCLQKIEIIHLKLPLSDPHTAAIVPSLEKTGFFFAGILPGSFKSSDALILQYLNNVPVDYEKIKTVSELGAKLVGYVRKANPQD